MQDRFLLIWRQAQAHIYGQGRKFLAAGAAWGPTIWRNCGEKCRAAISPDFPDFTVLAD